MRRPPRAAAALLALPLAAGLLLACSPAPAGGAAPAREPGRLAGEHLWTNPDGHAVREADGLRAAGRADLADALRPLAERATATWVTGSDADPYATARDLTTAARTAGRVPVLTVYDVPGRDCGQFSAGGAPDADAYLRWVGALAAGVADRRAVVVLEPDAVPHALEGCGGPTGAAGRYDLLSRAVDVLGKQPGIDVYLDAGNASWVEDLDALADALRRSGVERSAGFALNVSNFETTRASQEYGARLSDRLDGARFVVDTSRNGAGPPAGSGTGDTASWCNPASARLGTPPTTDPGLPGVDALLWVKQPGDSDGACAPGDPPAGTFDLRRAAALLGRPLTP